MKKTIALTGSSGTMGFQGFKELYARKDKYNIVLLNLDTKEARKKFSKYQNDPSVRLIWGDLTNYDDVLNMVTGADYVLQCWWNDIAISRLLSNENTKSQYYCS